MDAVYAIVGLPLLGSIILLFGGRRLGEPLAGVVGTVLGFGSFAATLVVWVTMLGRSSNNRNVHEGLFTWMPVGLLHVDFGFRLDPLSVFMCLFVTGVSSFIFLYAIGYMHGDPLFHRFFFYLNLFLFSMLVLVLADNFLFMFLGWEGVGFCSYGLVGFWFDRETAAVAAKKAFVTNRVGDFGFMIALFLMYDRFHSFDFSVVFSQLHGLPGSFATGIGFMLLLGACGKSAQIPLYMWLPDAMEGPTPISALIHAATMVTAGVYLLARAAPLLHHSSAAMWFVACLGAATAFVASSIACAQNDIKRILAYSTLAEIGFMFLAEGSGDYSSALYLTITHAFFKALLFLGSGAVIHAMNDEQDVKRMGGLRKYLPVTYVTFVIGYLALAAIPPFSGWWSHEAVLDAAWHKNFFLWLTGVAVDGMTAYYMSRQVLLVFGGEARWKDNRPVATGHGGDADHGHGEPHDSPWTMTLPLVVLAVGAFAGGLVDLPIHGLDFLDNWLRPVFAQAGSIPHLATGTKWEIGVIGTAVNFVGLFAGLALWRRHVNRPALEPAFLAHGWYLDEGLAATVSGPLTDAADGLAYEVDRGLVDGAINGVARLTAATGTQLRKLQSGYVRNYALGISFGLVCALFFVAVRVGN